MRDAVDPRALLEWLEKHRDSLVDFLVGLVEQESPSGDPEALEPVLASIADGLAPIGYRTRRLPGASSAGQLLAEPADGAAGGPLQVLLGHADTVWPRGTLASMPARLDGGRLHGPGVFDMKAGLTMAVYALRALSALGLRPAVRPVVLVSTDEEVGSADSRAAIEDLARAADRVLVLEPPVGPEGRVKTARKGVGEFTLTFRGRAAHAGLDPGSGVSAILEMAHQIPRLHALSDAERGVSVNVGVVRGGERTNVVAPLATAVVDVRVPTLEEGRRLEEALRGLQPVLDGTSIEVDGAVDRPPMEPTPRNRQLWERARAAGERLGLHLQEAMVGGGSDGNFTSLFAATLDGLGAVGDGAHATHEHVVVDSLVPRTALLALLLMEPPLRK